MILHEYAILGKGQTIHSSGQMEHHRNIVRDGSSMVGHAQCVITVDECAIPLDIINGLPYMKMRPHTDDEWEQLPKTELTSEQECVPSCLDCSVEDIDKWAEAIQMLKKARQWDMNKSAFDEMGYHRDLLGRETHRRHYEDATTRYAQKLDQVHRHEITEDHAEDRGETPREIPVDLEHGDDFHGQFFLGEVLVFESSQS